MSCTSTVSRPRTPLSRPAPRPGQVEHALDHHGTDEEPGDLQPDHRHDRNRRVAQPVPSQRPVAGEPTGASGPHEVLTQHLEDRRADVARQHGRLHERERDRGQDQRLQRAADALAPAGKAPGGQPAELHRDKRAQEDARPELGDRDPDLAGRRDRGTRDPAVAEGRDDAERHRDDGREQQPEQDERARDLEPARDLRLDGKLRDRRTPRSRPGRTRLPTRGTAPRAGGRGRAGDGARAATAASPGCRAWPVRGRPAGSRARRTRGSTRRTG